MANGFAPALLRDWADLAQQNYPGTKITPAGFLQMLLEHTDIPGVRIVEENGHIKTVTVKYKQRATLDQVAENDTCDIDLIPSWLEAPLTAVRFAKHATWFPRDTIARYAEEASRKTTIGTPPTGILKEIADQIAYSANAIIQRIDTRLLGDVDWGKNVVYGDDAVHDLNINKDATVNDLDTGYAKLLNDAFENEFMGELLIAGSGLFNIAEMYRTQNVLTANQAGVNLARFTGYRFYPDLWAKSSANWGTNDIGVFSKGAIHLVDLDKYKGFRTGHLANSDFFQITINVNGVPMKFDAQLREIDCPTEILDIYGNSGSYSEGYQLILKKTYGLFQLPSDAYAASDRLTGVNGAIHYNVTNICEAC